jgi:hypothetical protein
MKIIKPHTPGEFELAKKTISTNKNPLASFSNLIKITRNTLSTTLHWQIKIATKLKDLIPFSS